VTPSIIGFGVTLTATARSQSALPAILITSAAQWNTRGSKRSIPSDAEIDYPHRFARSACVTAAAVGCHVIQITEGSRDRN
jgi:hypothetical protein